MEEIQDVECSAFGSSFSRSELAAVEHQTTSVESSGDFVEMEKIVHTKMRSILNWLHRF